MEQAVFQESGKKKIKTAFTVQREGRHWFCVMNEDKAKTGTVKFQVNMGAGVSKPRPIPKSKP